MTTEALGANRPFRPGSLLDCLPPVQPHLLDWTWCLRWLDGLSAAYPHGNGLDRQIGAALLAFRGANDGRLFPTLAKWASQAECSVRTLSNKIREWQAAGFLVRLIRRTAQGQTSNAYTATMPGDAPLPPATLPEPLSLSTVQESPARDLSAPPVDIANDKDSIFQEGEDLSAIMPIRKETAMTRAMAPLLSLKRFRAATAARIAAKVEQERALRAGLSAIGHKSNTVLR